MTHGQLIHFKRKKKQRDDEPKSTKSVNSPLPACIFVHGHNNNVMCNPFGWLGNSSLVKKIRVDLAGRKHLIAFL